MGNGYILPEQGAVSHTLGVMSTIYMHSDKLGDRCRNQTLVSLKTQYKPLKKLQWEFIALETGVISDLHFNKIVWLLQSKWAVWEPTVEEWTPVRSLLQWVVQLKDDNGLLMMASEQSGQQMVCLWWHRSKVQLNDKNNPVNMRYILETELSRPLKKYVFIFGCMGLGCCRWAFHSCDVQALITVASRCRAQALGCLGSVAAAPGL